MKDQGEWCCETLAASVHCVEEVSIHFMEHKNGVRDEQRIHFEECINTFSISLFMVPETHTLFTWIPCSVDSSLYIDLICDLLANVSFQTCILLDSFPYSQRAGLNASPSQVYSLCGGFEDDALDPSKAIQPLPSPNYIQGLGAELFTYVLIHPSLSPSSSHHRSGFVFSAVVPTRDSQKNP